MTKEEAIAAMKSGKKVRHRHFSEKEFVCMKRPDRYLFEDGVELTPDEFWRHRPDSLGFDKDWEIVTP